MLLREASLMNLKKENVSTLWYDYSIRKLSLIGYYCYGLFKVDAGIKEENDELKRDIVGHAVLYCTEPANKMMQCLQKHLL